MKTAKKTGRAKDFSELRKQIDADPARLERVREHKSAMLAELRRELDLTQAVLADRLEVSQENVSQIERAHTDVRLSTLERYIEALGGQLELRAAFGDRSVTVNLGKTGARRKRPSRSSARKAAGTVNSSRAGNRPAKQGADVAATQRTKGKGLGKTASTRAGKVASADRTAKSRTS
jgi:transcriptional regulator with XRE-family HTH domain